MEIRQMLADYSPFDEQEEKDRELMLRYLDQFDDLSRGQAAGLAVRDARGAGWVQAVQVERDVDRSLEHQPRQR